MGEAHFPCQFPHCLLMVRKPGTWEGTGRGGMREGERGGEGRVQEGEGRGREGERGEEGRTKEGMKTTMR